MDPREHVNPRPPSDGLERLWQRDAPACARAVRLLHAIAPGDRVRWSGDGDPDVKAVMAAHRRLVDAGPVDHVVVSEPIHDAAALLLDGLVDRGVVHVRTTGRQELAVRAVLGRADLVALDRRAVRAKGMLSEHAALDDEVLLRLARRGFTTLDPSAAAPVALMFDHPRWLRETHDKLRLVLSAWGYEILELSPEEAAVRGLVSDRDRAWRVPDDIIAVGVNRTIGIGHDAAEMERVFFDGGRVPDLEATMRVRVEATHRGVAEVIRSARPALVVTVNGTTPISYAAAAAARACGVAVLALENSFLRDRFFAEATTGAVGNRHALARFRFDTIGKIPLTEAEERRLDDYLSRRDTSSSFDGTIRQDGPIAPDEVRRRLDIAPDAPIAVLLGQVAFDSVITLDNPHFGSSAAFIEAVVDHFATRPDWTLVIRLHPKEAEEGCDCTAQRLLSRGDLPANVRLVRGREVNTYSIMDAAKVGLTLTSQTGLELIARGRPCLVAGDAFYGRKGFTRDLAGPRLLGATIDDLLARPELADDERVLSRRLLDDLVFEFTVPYILDGMLDALPARLAEARALPRLPRPERLAPSRSRPLMTFIVAAIAGDDMEATPREFLLPSGARIEVIGIEADVASDLGAMVADAFGRARSPFIAVADPSVRIDETGISALLAAGLADDEGVGTVTADQIGRHDSWIEVAGAQRGLALGFGGSHAIAGHAFIAAAETLRRRGHELLGAESVREMGGRLGAKLVVRGPIDGGEGALAARVPGHPGELHTRGRRFERERERLGMPSLRDPAIESRQIDEMLGRFLALLEPRTPGRNATEDHEIVRKLARLVEMVVANPARTAPRPVLAALAHRPDHE